MFDGVDYSVEMFGVVHGPLSVSLPQRRCRPAAWTNLGVLMRVVLGILAFLPSLALAQGPGLKHYCPVAVANPPQTIEADVCVYGGTSGGVMTAVQASRMGKSAVLVVFRKHVGGLTSGGISTIDVGKKDSIGGLARDFLAKVG